MHILPRAWSEEFTVGAGHMPTTITNYQAFGNKKRTEKFLFLKSPTFRIIIEIQTDIRVYVKLTNKES